MLKLIGIIVLCLVAAFGFHALTMHLLAWRGVRIKRTKFGRALLFDTVDEDHTPVRMLNVGGTFQSATYLDDELWNELVCEYHRTYATIVQDVPRLLTGAVFGGGGFSFPVWFICHMKPAQLYTIEIDPQIIKIARTDFFLARVEQDPSISNRLHVICDDAWGWLTRHNNPLDLIVNDAFSGKQPLGSLATDVGARLIHDHLSDQGVYLANVRTPLEGRHAQSLYDTLGVFAREFSHIWLVPECPEGPKRLGNNVLVASDTDLVDAGCRMLAAYAWHA